MNISKEENWIFNNEYWYNTCDKCCLECDKKENNCKRHCRNIFRENCNGCKYDLVEDRRN